MPEHIDFNSLKTETPALVSYKPADINIVVSAGKVIKLEASPNGTEFAIGTVPEGKVWTMKCVIMIVESDE